jgi:hypothetical protein
VDDDSIQPFAPTSQFLTGGTDDPKQNIFSQAYMELAFDLPSATQAAFARNIPDGDPSWATQLTKGRDATTVQSTGTYWTSYVQGAFQGPEEGDKDPNAESATFGATPYTNDAYGSLVFCEALRDAAAYPPSACYPIGFSMAVSEVMAHEVGHQFGLQHEGGIMLQSCGKPHFFSNNSLSTIRNKVGLTPPTP